MNKPPAGASPPRDKGSSLDEVEQALSVLGGRHPSFVRTQRETLDAARAQAEAREASLVKASRRRLRRVALALLVATAAAVAIVVLVKLAARARALHAGLDAAAAPFEASGFTAVASSTLFAPHVLGAGAGAARCFVAVTAASSGALRVTHGASELTGSGSIGWCGCSAETVTVRAPEGASDTEGVRLLDADALVLGGREGWMASPPAKPAVMGDGDDACAEGSLVAWIAARRFPAIPVDARWLDAGPGAALLRAGFHAVAFAPAGRRFAVVDAPAESCFLAVAAAAAAPGTLALEEMDGTELARGASLVWCDAKVHAVTVRSDGAAPLLVAAAPATRVGGLLGTREWASRAQVTNAATWGRPGDLAWDATALMRASGLGTPTVAAAGDAPPPSARFLALSVHAANGVVVEPGAGANVASCAPPMEGNDAQAVCVLARAGASPWRAARSEPVGLCSAPLPFWMSPLEGVRDAEALRLELALVTLARRLASQGFEATTLTGVRELAPGRVSVLGLAGGDAVVALEVSQTAPWVFPYAEEGGAPWTVEDEPRLVALAPGAAVTLATKPAPRDKPEQRRTVVFRGRASP